MFVKLRQAYNGLPCGRIAKIQDGTARALLERNIAVPLDDTDREWVRQREEAKEGRRRGRKAMAAPPRNKMVSQQTTTVKELPDDSHTAVEGVVRPGGGVGD